MSGRPALALLLLAAILLARTSSAQPTDHVLGALEVELSRAMLDLRLPDSPTPYHLRYHVISVQDVSAVASFGALLQRQEEQDNKLGVEVRVGSPAFDNTGLGGWETGFSSQPLPRDLTSRSVRLAAWSLTDRAFKDAVEQMARKAAAWSPPPDHPGDFQLRGATISDHGTEARTDADALVEQVRQLSAAFPDDLGLERAEVHLAHTAGWILTVDTEGSRSVRPQGETAIVAVAHVRTDDGMLLTDHRLWLVRRPDQLPPGDSMAVMVERMARELASLRDAPAMEEEYVGPVLFQDSAAVDLFRYLLVPQVEGTPAEIPFKTVIGGIGGGSSLMPADASTARLGRRVLPAGWRVTDDPTGDTDHAAGFSADAEGTPASAVDLVTDGITRDLLMSRIPREGVPATNGHARGWPGDRLCGRAALLTVEPDRQLSRQRLLKLALQQARSYGHDHVLVVRRLVDEPSAGLGRRPSFIRMMAEADETLRLPPPISIVRVFADGREQPVRGAAFASVHRWVLRDIAAAGPAVEGTWYAPNELGGDRFTVTSGLPTFTRAAEVLVGEMELVPVGGDPDERPVVPPPVP